MKRTASAVWNGDLNFYDQINVFWAIRHLVGDAPAELMSFGSWQTYWGASGENQPMPGHVDWTSPPQFDRLAHLQTAADYALNRVHIENPARGAASDACDAGVLADRLPTP